LQRLFEGDIWKMFVNLHSLIFCFQVDLVVTSQSHWICSQFFEDPGVFSPEPFRWEYEQVIDDVGWIEKTNKYCHPNIVCFS